MRRRLTAAIERARRTQQERRERSAEAQRGYEQFLATVGVPVARMLASALKADGYPFTVATPGGGLRLTPEKGRDDYIEILLGGDSDPPEVLARTRFSRGSRTLADERPIKPGAAPTAISEEELLEFLLQALEPWLER